MAAQTFIRWSRLGVRERLLRAAQERGAGLGMAFLDGTSVRAHAKAAGAAKKARQRRSGTSVRRLAALVAARHRLSHRPGPGARAAPRRATAGPPAGRAVLGRGRPRLLQPRLPRARLGPRRAACHPGEEERGPGRLPRLDLQQPQPRRAPVGQTEGVAGRRHPLREDRPVLPGRPPPRRHPQLAQALTGPNGTQGSILPLRRH